MGIEGTIGLDTVFEHLREPIFAVGADGDIAFANERFLAVTGLDRDAAIGADCERFGRFVDDGFAEFRSAFEAVARGDADEVRVELSMVHPEEAPVPRRLPAEARLTPITEDGRVVGVLAALRDISERKGRERELERQNERLEEFARIVSHDLRNPLNVAAGHLELADHEDEEHLATVVDALERMEAIVEDTLRLARHGRTVGDVEDADVADVAAECWANVPTPGAELGVDGLTVRADPTRLRSLFENLFRNAVEHGGATAVRVGPLDGDGFYVEDDGRGIPADRRAQVFEPGYSTTDGGTGFGLAIVGQVTAAHGWDVTLAEGPDGGARFEVTGVDVV